MKCLPPAQALALVNVQGTAASGQEFQSLEKEKFKDAEFIQNKNGANRPNCTRL